MFVTVVNSCVRLGGEVVTAIISKVVAVFFGGGVVDVKQARFLS